MKFICEILDTRRLLAGYIVDTAFGSGGVADTFDAQLGAIAPTQTFLDTESRPVIVTRFFDDAGNKQLAIRRYHADGSKDKTFHGDGKLLFGVGSSERPDPLITLLQDNSIAVAMRQRGLPLLQRYTVKGKLDPAFAKNTQSLYKTYTPSAVRTEDALFTDPSGRVVFEQYARFSFGPDLTSLPPETISARISRFLPNGLADASFGTRGGLDISRKVAQPMSYIVQGKFLNRRDSMNFTAPQIDDDGNVIIAGSRNYARGSDSHRSTVAFSVVNVPFVYSFDRNGAVIRSFVAGIDSSKAKFVGQELHYSGLQAGVDFPPEFGVNALVVAPSELAFLAGTSNNPFSGSGLVVFKPKGSSFTVSGFDSTFNSAGLQLFGDRVWSSVNIARSQTVPRIVAVNPDASVGETIGTAGAFFTAPLTYLGVQHGRPIRLLGFAEEQKQRLRLLNLTEQVGSTSQSADGVVHVTGTAGGDYITVSQRSDSRIVITGAGATRSFPVTSVTKIQIEARGGDDLIDFDSVVSRDTAIYGQAGTDTIYGSRGKDLLDGGSGDDVISNVRGKDIVTG